MARKAVTSEFIAAGLIGGLIDGVTKGLALRKENEKFEFLKKKEAENQALEREKFDFEKLAKAQELQIKAADVGRKSTEDKLVDIIKSQRGIREDEFQTLKNADTISGIKKDLESRNVVYETQLEDIEDKIQYAKTEEERAEFIKEKDRIQEQKDLNFTKIGTLQESMSKELNEFDIKREKRFTKKKESTFLKPEDQEKLLFKGVNSAATKEDIINIRKSKEYLSLPPDKREELSIEMLKRVQSLK